ncbi:hypothetical protein [Agromyces sp. NPDC058126]|uniref:hypothetical protein n=1 Tax=Agromyces sp. NPDC058126 TaxID=3346350 RepID=UPI0036D7C735
MSRRRRHARAAVVVAIATSAVAGLSACSYVDRIAVRLNEDQTVDVLSCESLDEISGARVYLDDDLSATLRADELTDSAGGLTQGDVIWLSEVPMGGEWSILGLSVDGVLDSHGWTLDGTFEREDLVVGEWVWARTGVFFGAVPVEGCEPK